MIALACAVSFVSGMFTMLGLVVVGGVVVYRVVVAG